MCILTQLKKKQNKVTNNVWNFSDSLEKEMSNSQKKLRKKNERKLAQTYTKICSEIIIIKTV